MGVGRAAAERRPLRRVVPAVGRIEIDIPLRVLGLQRAQISHRHAPRQGAVQLDVHMQKSRAHQRGINEPGHGAGVVEMRIPAVGKKIQQLSRKAAGLIAEAAHGLDILCQHRALAGQVDARHVEGQAAVKDLIGRLRVHPDVELRRGGPVAAIGAAAHQIERLRPLGDARLTVQGRRNVGERAGRHQRHVRGGHHRLHNKIHRVPVLRRAAGRRQAGAVHTALAVDVGGDHQRQRGGARVAGIDRDIRAADLVQYLQRIAGDVGQVAVAAHRSDPQDLQMPGRQHDGKGVVVAGIAVENDFFHFPSPFGIRARSAEAGERRMRELPFFTIVLFSCAAVKRRKQRCAAGRALCPPAAHRVR